MRSSIKRNVLLLIPSLDEYGNNQQEMVALSKLRRGCNLIIDKVSETINNQIHKELNNLHPLIVRFGIPNITLNIVDCKNDNYQSGIRLCLTKYNNMDFSNEFHLQREEYKDHDISHLVEVEIKDNQRSPKWSASSMQDSKGNSVFDAKVTSNVSCLFDIILSFMIDTYVYYIVGLYKDFEFRTGFSVFKIDYLQSVLSPDEKKKIYNLSAAKDSMDDIAYLPVSLRHQPSRQDLKLKETVSDYYQIIFKFVLQQHTVKICQDDIDFFDVEIISTSDDTLIKKALEDYQKNHRETPFKYFAVYKPRFEDLGIQSNPEKQARLKKDVRSYLTDKREFIDVRSLGEGKKDYYIFTYQYNDDLFPLFSYFEWVTMDFESDENEELQDEQ